MGAVTYTSINSDNADEVQRIAELHHNAPLDWIDNYVVNAESVANTITELTNAGSDSATHVIIARVGTGTMIGFHWLTIVEQGDRKIGRINSLWVDPAHRRQKIASTLKQHGETWLIEQGIGEVTTSVFYVNQKMISLNINAGFTPWQLQMTKKLL